MLDDRRRCEVENALGALQLGRLLATAAAAATATIDIGGDASHVRLGERIDELPARVPRGRLVAAMGGLGGAERGLGARDGERGKKIGKREVS